MTSLVRHHRERGFLGLLAAAVLFGVGVTALGGAHVVEQLLTSRQQALQEIDEGMAKTQPLTPTQQDRARDANRGLYQVVGGGGGGHVVLGVHANGAPASTLDPLVASAAAGALIERAVAGTPAPTQSVTLPPDALKLGPCSRETPAYCLTRSSCAAQGGHWWTNDTCNRQPQPACTASQPAYCFEPASCEAIEGIWIDGACKRGGCWNFVDGKRDEAPIPRGYAGGSTTVTGLISLDSHPADPKWSHLITAVWFRWSFDDGESLYGDPVVLCPGPLGGSASMSNTGNQFGPTAYVPNAYLNMWVNNSAGRIPVWHLGSADLPPPGATVTRRFVPAMVPEGTKEGDKLRIQAAGYAGRLNTYTYEFEWVHKRAFAAQGTRSR